MIEDPIDRGPYPLRSMDFLHLYGKIVWFFSTVIIVMIPTRNSDDTYANDLYSTMISSIMMVIMIKIRSFNANEI